ncbi:MAG: hypothetical protein IKS28_06280 [Clostridia bacterium]|nr:hypothetical protein [Clostridia bacterium]
MKIVKILGVVLTLAIVLSVSALAAENKVDFEKYSDGQALAFNEDNLFSNADTTVTVATVDGSKVAVLDQTNDAARPAIRIYFENKPVATYGSVFTFSYRVKINADGAESLVFSDRITDKNDNEGFNLFNVWSNGAYEGNATDVVWGFTFNEWHEIAHTYDFGSGTVVTRVDGEAKLTQTLPTSGANTDWSDLCYDWLGKRASTDNSGGITYLDDMKWYSGDYKAPVDPENGNAQTADITAVVALIGVISLAGAVVCKKK